MLYNAEIWFVNSTEDILFSPVNNQTILSKHPSFHQLKKINAIDQMKIIISYLNILVVYMRSIERSGLEYWHTFLHPPLVRYHHYNTFYFFFLDPILRYTERLSRVDFPENIVLCRRDLMDKLVVNPSISNLRLVKLVF